MSLRTKIVLVVAAIHAVAFIFLAWVVSDLAERSRRELESSRQLHLDSLRLLVEGRVAEADPTNVRYFSDWQGPDDLRTAMIFQTQEISDAGDRVQGQWYNIKCRRRPMDFDEEIAKGWIERSVAAERTLQVNDHTYVVPCKQGNRKWGGAYLVFPATGGDYDVTRVTIGVLLASSLLMFAAIYLLFTRLVLSPVDDLASGARRVARGDYSRSVPERPRRDEMAALIRSFNLMQARVGNFSEELSTKVDEATRKARRAERELMEAQRLASTGKLAAGIAHEINNPLGGMMNAVESLRTGEIPKERRNDYFQLVGEGLTRIRDIVRRVLQLTPRGAAAPVSFSVHEALTSALALVDHRVRHEGVVVRQDRVDESLVIRGIPAEIQQVFLNLMINALDALAGGHREGEPPTIRVDISPVGEEVEVVVSDNGPGIDEATLREVKDLFFTTKEVGQGTGLGLSLCAGIIANHSGTMAISSVKGEGFEVSIRLPRAEGGGDAP